MRYYCKCLLLLLISILLFLKVVAQPKQISPIPSMPSPTVANLAKFTDFPEIDQNGYFPIEIPIWNMEYRSFKLPIKLKYNTSGIKVSQEGSWVGMGWSLNSLCFVSRSVRSLPDDLDNVITLEGGGSYQAHGWLSMPKKYMNFPNIEGDNRSNEEKSATLLVNNPSEKFDSEPDVFYLNIGEIKEKFIFDHDGKIVFLDPNTKFKTSYNIENNTKGIKEFVIIENNGNEYYFGTKLPEEVELNGIEETTVTLKHIGFWEPRLNSFGNNTLEHFWRKGVVETQNYRTTWFLKQVKLTNGQSISFLYEPTTEEFDVLLDEYCTKCNYDDCNKISPILQTLWSGLSGVHHKVETKYLKKVTAPSFNVSFSLSLRNDIKGGKKLDSITIYDFKNEFKEKFNFVYEDQVTEGAEDVFDRTRTFLKSFNVNGELAHTFYYNGNKLPHKKSYKQDFWGYYSEKSTSFIPRIFVYPNRNDYLMYSCFLVQGDNTFKELTGSDRTVDDSKVGIGCLEKIKLPTGGFKKFIFEPNDFYDSNWGEIQGGGLRIKEIYYLNEAESVLLSRNYNYRSNSRSSGILVNGLSFAIPVGYSIPSSSAFMYSEKENDPDVWDYFTLRRGNNYFPLVSLDGALISYEKVTITETGNGKTEKLFYPPKSYLTHATDVNWASSFLSTQVFGPFQEFIRTNYKQNIDLKDYGLSTVTQRIDVDVYEEVGKINWNSSGTSGIDYYFYFNDNPIKLKVANYFQNLTIAHNDGTLSLGKIQKSGKNIFPFPPISDDGIVTYGKLKKVNFFKEGEIDPFKIITYEYEKVGAPIDVYGLNYRDVFTCNKILTPLPLEVNWFSTYGNNGQLFIQNNISNFHLPKVWALYKYHANASCKLSREIEELFLNNTISQRKDYSYNNDLLLIKEEVIQSDGVNLKTEYKYPKDYEIDGSVYDVIPLNLHTMVNKYIINLPIETTQYRNDFVTGSSVNLYKFNEHNILVPDVRYQLEIDKPVELSNLTSCSKIDGKIVFNKDGLYEPEFFTEFDNLGNLIQFKENSNFLTCYVWGYNKTLPTAKVMNAKWNQIAYTSFEDNTDYGNWLPIGGTVNENTPAKTGKKYLELSGGVLLQYSFAEAGKYKLEYWSTAPITFSSNSQLTIRDISTSAADANGWVLYIKEVTVAAPTTMGFGANSAKIDEVRLYPAAAQMTTYTYEPLVGMTSETNEKNVTTYYEYDSFGRLSVVRDQDRNIVKTYDYHYKE